MKRYPYVVVGAGAGGLVIAIGLAKLRRRVLLIEKGQMGGDCTNVGCIPSKALIAAAEAAYGARHAKELGIEVSSVHAEGALAYVRSVVEQIRAKEEPPELEKIGVDVARGEAHFLDSHTLEVEGVGQVEAKKIVIATGSKPRIPQIEGLSATPYQTNETIFDLDHLPKSLAVIGAGTIGCELAQAFARLGTKVTLIHPHEQLMDREDPRVGAELKEVFLREGIEIRAPATLKKVSYNEGSFELELSEGSLEGSLEGSFLQAEELLLATGREPRVDGMDIERAGIDYSQGGIVTDSYGRTSQPHIFAIGDVRGQALFTHVAERDGRAVLINLLLPRWLHIFARSLADEQHIPRVTFTAPEVAVIGISEAEAIECYGKKRIAIYEVEFDEIDRAICQKQTAGFVRIITKKWSSRILGATICASRAGEMLMEIGVAMASRRPLRKIARLLHPYPIYNLAIRKAADQWLAKTILRKK